MHPHQIMYDTAAYTALLYITSLHHIAMQYTTLHHAPLHRHTRLCHATRPDPKQHCATPRHMPHATQHYPTRLYHIVPQNSTLHHCTATRGHIALRCKYHTHRMITWRAVDWAKQYGCGENDVVDLNVSDAYWSLYYVTLDRMRAGARLTFLYCLLASVTSSHLAFNLVAYSSLFIAVV